MFKTKKHKLITTLSCVLTFTLLFGSIGVYAGESTNGYDDTLKQIGISLNDYQNMPSEKKDLWRNFKIKETKENTKYFRIIHNLLRAPIPYSADSNENPFVEINKTTYLRETTQQLLNPIVPLSSNSSSVSTTWVKFTTTLASSYNNEYGLSTNVTFVSPISTTTTVKKANSTHAQLRV